jgi:ribose 5-phosphate isomerase B
MMYSIAIGCDPNAMELKFAIIDFLKSKGYGVTDFGSEDPIYANTAIQVATHVATHQYDRGILICGTGIGMSIAANKVKGAYAALLSDSYSAERAIKSNNTNIACLGALTLGKNLALNLIEIWLKAEFDENSPSAEKVNRIIDYENKTSLSTQGY